MIILPYKMIADLMMSNGEYNFLIVCRTPRQVDIIYNWFAQNRILSDIIQTGLLYSAVKKDTIKEYFDF